MENITNLAKKGYRFFPCLPNKVPATSNGFYDATNNIEELKSFFNNNNYLIGFPTGSLNKNVVIIDIDINKPIPGTESIDQRSVNELLDELESIIGQVIRDGFQVETPSGGRHLYFQAPINIEIKSGNRYFDKLLPVDVKAGGGYVIFPDDKSYIVYDSNIEIDNFYDYLPALPEAVINFKKQETNQDIDNVLPQSEIIEIQSALSFLSSDDRDTWVKIGLALKSTDSPSAYGLWNSWSQTSAKYNPADMERRWQGLKPNDITIASLFHEAKKQGWHTTYQKENINIEVLKKTFDRKPFPPELLKPPGLVGELMDFIEFRAIKSQPIYSLAGSLTAVGALLGRKIRTDSDIRTNIYSLAVGTSGSGKEACRAVIKRCFYEAGAGALAKIDDLASDAAIITALDGAESQVFLLDEIGRFLQTTNMASASRNTHLYNIISVLLKLYSNSNSVYEGKAYADRDKQITLLQPNLCIYGTTVPETLYKGLTTSSLNDGFLSRMLVFESNQHNPRKKTRRELSRINKIPKSLLDQIAGLYAKPINSHPVGNIDFKNPNPQVVFLNENALDMVDDFENYIYDLREKLISEKRPDSVYNRTSQLAEQIALIIAGGDNPDNPVITENEMSYGISLSHYLADNMLYIAENFIADNETEHITKWFLQIIRASGKISLSKLTKKTQKLKGYERNDIIETLIDSKQIYESFEGDGVQQTRYFTAI